MFRITLVEHAGAEGHPKELLDAVKASHGVTPNMTTTMARSAVLDGWLSLSGALRKGSIDGATGERIALGVAEANGRGYCLSAHSYLGANVAKLDADELERARHFDSSYPKAAAILAFVEAVRIPPTASRCASSTSHPTPAASGGAATATSTGSSTRPAALLRRRDASINDYRITADERRIAVDPV